MVLHFVDQLQHRDRTAEVAFLLEFPAVAEDRRDDNVPDVFDCVGQIVDAGLELMQGTHLIGPHQLASLEHLTGNARIC